MSAYISAACIPNKNTEIKAMSLDNGAVIWIGNLTIHLPEIEVAKEIAALLKTTLESVED